MYYIIKNITYAATFNTCVFLILIVGIQNSSNKSKINFIFDESVNLPISFIVGTSFISGSIFGSFISFSFFRKNDNK